MEAIPLLRALKPFKLNPNLTQSICVRCSSFSYSPSSKIHTGGRKVVKRAYDGVLLDAAGTLLQLAKPVEETYAVIGQKYGLTTTPAEIKQGFKRAFSASWPEDLRYKGWEPRRPVSMRFSYAVSFAACELRLPFLAGDGRPFWKIIVSEATGCDDDSYFEEVYQHYANGDAWRLPAGASETLSILKDYGVKLAVVSNFDTRLRKLLKDLDVVDMFDAVIVSAEVGYEKPDVKIFGAALDQIGVEKSKAVHVGDDPTADKEGANAAGIDCWLWGTDVKSFANIQSRILIEP